MKVIEAILADAEEILLLQRAAYKSEGELNGNLNIPPLTQSLDDLKKSFIKNKIFKINNNEKLIASGQAKLESNCCYIGRLAVLPEYQNQGIGSQLLTSLEKAFPNVNRIELFTGVKSKTNIAMYKKRGYKELKTGYLGQTEVIYLERSIST